MSAGQFHISQGSDHGPAKRLVVGPPHDPSRNPYGDGTVRDLLILAHDRPRGDDAPRPDRSAREKDRADSDQAAFSDPPGMHHRMVPDRHVRPDFKVEAGIAMQHAQILDVRRFPDANRGEVAPEDRSVPNAGSPAERHVSDDDGVLGDPRAAAFDHSGHFRSSPARRSRKRSKT
jgi:hypothetical protein